MRGRRQVALLGAGAIVTAALGISVTAYAASTAFDGTDGAGSIHACFVQSTGSLRVIDTVSGASCKKGESALSWAESASPAVAQYDNVQGLAEPAYYDSNGPAPARILIATLTFTQPVGGFVDPRLAAKITFDPAHLCSSGAEADLTMHLDGAQTGPTVVETEQPVYDDAGNPTGTYREDAGGEPFLESPWVGAGTHTITVEYSPSGCPGGGSGTVTISGLHVLVTSP